MSAAKVMPVGLALHAHVTRRALEDEILGMSSLRSHHTLSRQAAPPNALHTFRAGMAPRLPLSPSSTLPLPGKGATAKKKKRVVFADAKGLALTAVRLFSTDPPASDPDDLSPPTAPKGPPAAQGQILRLRLAFPQPSANLPSFHTRLTKALVRLESCSLVGRSLSGVVRAYNISAKKAVHIHITFDSWRSHQDIPCVQIQQHVDSETNVFVFSVPLPAELSVQDRLEFCVSFRPGLGNIVLWDNNGGQNYRVTVEPVSAEDVPMIWNKLFMTEQLTAPSRAQTTQSPDCLDVVTDNTVSKTMGGPEKVIPLC